MALTRARERLYLTRAAVRSAWGAANAMPASRFLDDVPDETIDWKRLASSMEVLRGGGTGWGSKGEGGFAWVGGAQAPPGRALPDDDDFAPPVGAGTKRRGAGARGDRLAKRASARLEARGKQSASSPAGAKCLE